jgi:hypothetical protein
VILGHVDRLKRPSLFTVGVFKDGERHRQFRAGSTTCWMVPGMYVCDLFSSFSCIFDARSAYTVEPFGIARYYDVVENYIVYTTKDPKLPEA